MYVYHCILYISPFPCAVFIFTRRFQCVKCGQLLHRTDKDQRRQDTFGLGTQHHEPSHGEVVGFSNCDTQNITKSSPSGWWLSHPSEKYESQLGLLFPIYGQIKPVPNHQPDIYLVYPSVWVEFFRCKLNKCTIGVLGQSVGLPKFWREGSRSQRHSTTRSCIPVSDVWVRVSTQNSAQNSLNLACRCHGTISILQKYVEDCKGFYLFWIHRDPSTSYLDKYFQLHFQHRKGHWQPPEFPGRLLTLCFCRKSGIGKTLWHVAENGHLVEKIMILITWWLTSQCGKCTWKASKHVLSGWFKPNQIICRRTIPKLMPHAWTQLVWMKWYHARFHMELQHLRACGCWSKSFHPENHYSSPTKNYFRGTFVSTNGKHYIVSANNMPHGI